MTQDIPDHLKHRISPKKYSTAVVLSGLFGILGIHFFYIGRIGYGLFDLVLSLTAAYLFITGEIGAALLVLALDYIHTVVVTFRLLTGKEVDGQGRRILYPGQKIEDTFK